MSVDYDIVIIGGSLAGRDAALKAVRQRAKVALVEPLFRHDLIKLQAIGKICKVVGKFNNLAEFGFFNQADE
ncbi:MAG: mercuric reductase, partial [Cyanobacteria bacterium J06643_5]